MSGPVPVVFGEVLFDVFDDGTRVLGGAPFNVAWHLQGFGERPLFISRIGEDAAGDEVLDRMIGWGMRTDGIQRDPVHPTGRVDVQVVDDEPGYTIQAPSAWDHIVPAPLPASPSVVYHGTLALRSATSRSAIEQLRRETHAPVFIDVNLRSPWWHRDQVLRDICQADTVKLNADELVQLADGDADRLRTDHRIRRLVLTRGAQGADIIEALHHESVRPVPVDTLVDTVGAGDALSAVVLLGTLRGWSRQTTLQRAQAFASQIVQQRGATQPDRTLYHRLLQAWSTPVMS